MFPAEITVKQEQALFRVKKLLVHHFSLLSVDTFSQHGWEILIIKHTCQTDKDKVNMSLYNMNWYRVRKAVLVSFLSKHFANEKSLYSILKQIYTNMCVIFQFSSNNNLILLWTLFEINLVK